jgi:hypothetical protein
MAVYNNKICIYKVFLVYYNKKGVMVMDFNKMGTSAQQFEDANKAAFAEIGKLRDGVSTHRIVVGPARVETIWYPTLVEKEGKLVQSMRTIVRPEGGTVLDPIVKFDEELTRKVMRQEGASEDEVKKYKSALRPQIVYRFLVFDRDLDNQGKPTLRPFDYPFTVKDELEDLQTTPNKKHPGFLEYGMCFMFDVYIEKAKDPTKPGIFGTSYSVKPVTDTLPIVTKKLSIPISWTTWREGQGECPWNWSDFFTDDELQAINDYDSDLLKLSKPNTDTEIEEKLIKSPIYLHGVFTFGDKKDVPMFPVLCMPEVLEKLVPELGKYLLIDKKEVATISKVTRQIGAGVGKAEVIEEAKVIEEKVKPISLKDKLSLTASKPVLSPTVQPMSPVMQPTSTGTPPNVEQSTTAPQQRRTWTPKKPG